MPSNKVNKTNEEWSKQLTEEQFRVTRMCGTEKPFENAYWNHKGEGTYHCICCGAVLFDSVSKFDSETGWPSFFETADGHSVAQTSDTSYDMIRTEVTCSRCNAHLGHVFPDGPPPSNHRYCINSAALSFESRSASK